MSVYSNNQYQERRDNDAWSKVFHFIKPGSKILDIGCSSGNLGAALKKYKENITVVGIDIDEPDVKLAKKHLDDAHVVDIEREDFSRLGTFDVIIMADVIEHLVDPVTALKKIKKLLKPGGRLVFSIPNMANLTTRIELLKGRFEYKDFGLLDRTHLHFYDHVEVARVFSEAGLTIKETDCTVRNIPDDILKKDLSSAGITLTPKLKKYLNETEALIYQFIGYVEVGETKKQPSFKTTSHLDSTSRQMSELIEKHAQEQKVLRDDAANARKEAEAARKELAEILHSKGWKMLEKGHTIVHHTKKILGREK